MDTIFLRGYTKEKRGRLNFIETMGKALFSLMDDQDAQFLNEKVDELQVVEYFNDTSNQLLRQRNKRKW